MIEIVRSTWSMALAVAAALLLALGRALDAIAFAVLTGPGAVRTFHDLATAGAWLSAVAGLVLFGAVGAASGQAVVDRRWRAIGEIAAAALATFVLAVGLLVNAASAPQGSLGANIVVAVGLGGWGVLLTVKAAERSLVERVVSSPRDAGLWLGAALAVFTLAVGAGLPNASVHDRGLALATALLWLLGLSGLGAVLAVARARRRLVAPHQRRVELGIWILAAGYLAAAIVAGVVFGPLPSLTGVRAGVSVATTIEVVGAVVLALAAWDRLRDLSLVRGGLPPFEVPMTSSCGHPLPTGAHFCPQCGAPAHRPPPSAPPTIAVTGAPPAGEEVF